MNLLLLHLSDIHVRASDDPVLRRGAQILSAVRSVAHNVAGCVVVVSGDVVFAGAAEQYLLTADFLAEMLDGLRDLNIGAPVVVMIPGNHDCDFSISAPVRDILINSVKSDWNQAGDAAVREICTRPQDEFFGFMQMVNGVEVSIENRIYYETRVELEASTLVFRCFNTAWMSELTEKPGTLIYPLDVLPQHQGGTGDLFISLLHHPYNWFSPDNGRALRKHVEATSDIILTGHEHDQTRHVRYGATGETNEYLEGGVLQENGNESVSKFNVILLDLQSKRQRVIHFDWNDNLYSATESSSPEWEDLQVNRLVERREFEVSSEMLSYLDDPEAALTHSRVGTVKLSDIFVYPDLREVSLRRDSTQLFGGASVFDKILSNEHVLISGSERSGKTSLAKILYVEFHKRGYVPVMLKGNELKLQYDERFFNQVHRAFEKQYNPGRLEKYNQLDPSRRVLIVDNFHKLELNRKGRDQFLKLLSGFSQHVVVFANDLTQQVRDLASADNAAEVSLRFMHLRILEFGHLLRDQLIERWFALGDDFTTSELDLAHRMSYVHRVLNTIIGKNFVPAHPIFILSILQAEEASQQLDVSASTYGYFYELFIKTQLARGTSHADYDTRTAYLAFLAYNLYLQRRSSIQVEALRDIHDAYEKAYALRLEFRPLIQEFLDANVLVEIGGYYEFRYRYSYYYFVALHMKDYITELEVQEHISEMSKRLYVEEYANIMLFMAHLSKHPFIIEQMLEQARALYDRCDPATLTDDISFLNDTYAAVAEVVYLPKDTSAARKEMLQRMDEEEALEDDIDGHELEVLDDTREEPDDEALLDPITRLNVALKSLQILGQILKNFPGSMRAETKLAIASECYMLGLRALSSIYGMFRENQDQLLKEIVEILKEDFPHEHNSTIVKRAKVAVFSLAKAITYGMIKRMSHAVGSHRLLETYRQVLQLSESSAVSLIDMSIKLDHTHTTTFPDREVVELGRFLEPNLLPSSVLREMVVAHFYMFPVELPIRQRVCGMLKIPIREAAIYNPHGKKILPEPR